MKGIVLLILMTIGSLAAIVRGKEDNEINFLEDKYHPDFIDKSPNVRLGVTEDRFYWNKKALDELKETLKISQNKNKAKNVILFLGDGMSLPSITAARIYAGQLKGNNGEEEALSFEKFPHIGLSKTYNVNYQVPDSAGTATAYLTGVKTNAGVVGVDATVTRGDCTTMKKNSIVDSIVQWSQEAGKKTGIVTTTRITHATPACAYAHSVDRKHECDGRLPSDTQQSCPSYKDIARQLIEDEPGKNLNVIMGGGFQFFDGSATEREGDPLTYSCVRRDGKQLWKQFLQEKWDKQKVASFIRSKSELKNVDLQNTDHILGLFSNSHLPFDFQVKEKSLDIPSLKEMTEHAIKALNNEKDGFFLLVEGGRIDHAHHSGMAKIALDEIVAFDEAVKSAIELTEENETLIIVTADHAHTLAMSGYQGRGNPITGIASYGSDNKPYTTLSYANGPGFNDNFKHGVKKDLTGTDTTSFYYKPTAPVPKTSETHGGDDVGIYARGPWSHLFHSVHEQNYIAHVMAFSSCIGNYNDGEHCTLN